jgi:hypothetical protein
MSHPAHRLSAGRVTICPPRRLAEAIPGQRGPRGSQGGPTGVGVCAIRPQSSSTMIRGRGGISNGKTRNRPRWTAMERPGRGLGRTARDRTAWPGQRRSSHFAREEGPGGVRARTTKPRAFASARNPSRCRKSFAGAAGPVLGLRAPMASLLGDPTKSVTQGATATGREVETRGRPACRIDEMSWRGGAARTAIGTIACPPGGVARTRLRPDWNPVAQARARAAGLRPMPTSPKAGRRSATSSTWRCPRCRFLA